MDNVALVSLQNYATFKIKKNKFICVTKFCGIVKVQINWFDLYAVVIHIFLTMPLMYFITPSVVFDI